MEALLIIVVAFAASILTFFSGFGLGTLLTPAFLVFFPLPIAITMTAIVHFANNIFKTGLIGSHINRKVLLLFGLPAIIGVLPGVYLLDKLQAFDKITEYTLFGKNYELTWLGLIIGVLMIIFAIAEIKKGKQQVKDGHLSIGGFISGFFGGLSGHQGALRSLFLLGAGLGKEAFIATGVAISLFIDVTRIPLYLNQQGANILEENWMLITAAILAAFLGAVLGKRFLKKTSIHTLRFIVGSMLLIFGLLLILGIMK